MISEIERELLAAAASMPFSAIKHLWAMGADRRFVARLHGAGDLGIANVSLSGGTWEPVGPTRRLLVGVRSEFGELLDVAALSSTVRDEWALRVGDGWALGLDRYAGAADAACAGKRVRLRLFANPFDWLTHAGAGICVLDWGLPALSALRALGERVTLDVETGAAERLRVLLTWGGLPRVSTPGDDDGMGRIAA